MMNESMTESCASIDTLAVVIIITLDYTSIYQTSAVPY